MTERIAPVRPSLPRRVKHKYRRFTGLWLILGIALLHVLIWVMLHGVPQW